MKLRHKIAGILLMVGLAFVGMHLWDITTSPAHAQVATSTGVAQNACFNDAGSLVACGWEPQCREYERVGWIVTYPDGLEYYPLPKTLVFNGDALFFGEPDNYPGPPAPDSVQEYPTGPRPVPRHRLPPVPRYRLRPVNPETPEGDTIRLNLLTSSIVVECQDDPENKYIFIKRLDD